MSNVERQRKFRASRRAAAVTVLGASAKTGLRPTPVGTRRTPAPQSAAGLGATPTAA